MKMHQNSISIVFASLVFLSFSAHAKKKNKTQPGPNSDPFAQTKAHQLPDGLETLDIFLLMGQSNMKGRGAIPSETNQNQQIIMMHKTTDTWYLARHPLHLASDPKDFRGKSSAGAGPGIAFARALAKKQPNTRIALLPCAKGGSSIGQWSKGRFLYDETIRKAKLALSQGPKGKTRIAGALWLQGEADTNTENGVRAYRTSIGTLIDNLREDLGIADLPFIACTIAEEKEIQKFRRMMNTVLLDLPNIRPYTACVDSRSYARTIDTVHFDTRSQNENGRRFATKYLELRPTKKKKKQ